MKPTLIDAIISLVPSAEVSVCDGNVTWHKPSTSPVTNTEIQAELTRLQTEYELKEYQRNRARTYPSIVDQLDTLYHGGYDAWKATIEAVKNQYPKP